MSCFLLTILCLSICAQAYAEGPNYLIKGRDVLRITVYDHPELNTEVRVAEAGTITFPLVGEVKIDGLTVHQVEKKLADLLAQGLIVNPQVTVFIEQFKNKQVTVIGKVVKPGQYALMMDEPTYVADVISNCMRVTEDAGDTLTILRRVNGKPEKIVVDLPKLLKDGDLSQNVELLEGDLLYIPRAGYFYIYGEVTHPGFYKIEPGLTAIKAVAMAGGLTAEASTGGIRVIRKANGAEITVNVRLNSPVQADEEFFKNGDMSQNIKIQDDDVVYVPKAAYFYVYGEVNHPGYYRVEPGLTVIKAISIAGGVTNKASTGRIKIVRKTDGKEISIPAELDHPVQGEDVVIIPESFF